MRSNWRKAHASIVVEAPDVVLLDIYLGDADHDWRALDQLTLDPSTRYTPGVVEDNVALLGVVLAGAGVLGSQPS